MAVIAGFRGDILLAIFTNCTNRHTYDGNAGSLTQRVRKPVRKPVRLQVALLRVAKRVVARDQKSF